MLRSNVISSSDRSEAILSKLVTKLLATLRADLKTDQLIHPTGNWRHFKSLLGIELTNLWFNLVLFTCLVFLLKTSIRVWNLFRLLRMTLHLGRPLILLVVLLMTLRVIKAIRQLHVSNRSKRRLR